METLTITKHHYMTLTEFDGIVANAGDPGTFDDAVDQFAEQMDAGNPSVMFRVDPGENGAPMMVDVTADAIYRIKMRCEARDIEQPEWAA